MGTPSARVGAYGKPLTGTSAPGCETRSMARPFTPKHQRGGKPLPTATTARHGTRTGFQYGCRCALCVKVEHEYQREYQRAYREKKATAATEGLTP
jgi:hypothetical protein